MHIHRHLMLLGLALALVLSACKPTPQTPQADSASGPAVQATSPTSACPDADFQKFLKRFESSVDVQRASAAKVVTMDSMDGNAQPEPKQITKQVKRADLKFPILLGPEQRKAEGLEETVTQRGPVEWEVKHAVPDSGVQVRFNFQAMPCWTLVRVSDDTF